MTKLGAIWASAVLAVTILFGAGVAHAQCASITAQPEDVYGAFIDYLSLVESFPLQDPAACEKLAKTTVSACHKAVSDVASCVTGLAGSLFKGAKPVCGTFKNESGCIDDAKGDADAAKAEAAADAADAHEDCDDLLLVILDDCENGIAM